MAAKGVDDSNPFDRDPTYEMEYGSGGRDIKIVPADEGVKEGISGTVARGVEDANFDPFPSDVDF